MNIKDSGKIWVNLNIFRVYKSMVIMLYEVKMTRATRQIMPNNFSNV